MNIDDLSKQLERVHIENREDHQRIFGKLDEMNHRVTNVEKDIIERPTFNGVEKIVTQKTGLWHWVATGIGTMIGTVSGFIAVYIFRQDK